MYGSVYSYGSHNVVLWLNSGGCLVVNNVGVGAGTLSRVSKPEEPVCGIYCAKPHLEKRANNFLMYV